VAARIDALAGEIAARHPAGTLVMVSIAEGALRFAAALARGLEARGVCSQEIRVGARRTSGTSLLETLDVENLDPRALAGRTVLIVDDIADEGRTLQEVERRVARAGPASIERAVLVSKLARRKVRLALDYVGFEIEDGWVVGFGMDLDGAYRELDHLAILEP
jgi:hypoxanthine phosphoribosyltransferase